MSTPNYQDQINALAARLAALDGQGLPAPSQGFVQQTNAKITGLQTDLRQSVLSLEGLLQSLQISVTSLWTALSTALGISPPTTPPSTIPPPG